MKKILILLLSVFTYSASAQVFDTGSAQLDADLKNINVSASANFSVFSNNLSASYGITNKKIDYMRVSLNMAPGEIYFALEISKYSNRPIDDIIGLYRTHKSKGWGYIAKQAGIKPGSDAFHQMKNNARGKSGKGGNNGNGKGKGKKK